MVACGRHAFMSCVSLLICVDICVQPKELPYFAYEGFFLILNIIRSVLGVYCRGAGNNWHVFYHFVGAVPGSTELLLMLQRLLKELNMVNVSGWM